MICLCDPKGVHLNERDSRKWVLKQEKKREKKQRDETWLRHVGARKFYRVKANRVTNRIMIVVLVLIAIWVIGGWLHFWPQFHR